MDKFLQNSFARCPNWQSPPGGNMYGVTKTTIRTIIIIISYYFHYESTSSAQNEEEEEINTYITIC